MNISSKELIPFTGECAAIYPKLNCVRKQQRTSHPIFGAIDREITETFHKKIGIVGMEDMAGCTWNG